jgi:hypothetical protein
MPDESKDVINRNEIETEYKIDEEESQAPYYEAEKLFFLSRRKEDNIDKIIELYKAAADLNNV